jgi:CRP-like cAMP-binding protein
MAYERLGQIEDSISDYNTCIECDDNCAPAYFNRGGLYHSLGKADLAIADMNKAIELDPLNMAYRENRALILRKYGRYLEAIDETIICRAVQQNPALMKNFREVKIDPKTIEKFTIDDPVLTAAAVHKHDRLFTELDTIAAFLGNVKFFALFNYDRDVLRRLAECVALRSYGKNDIILSEELFHLTGDSTRDNLYIVLDGEVQVTELKVAVPDTKELRDTIAATAGPEHGTTSATSTSSSPIMSRQPSVKFGLGQPSRQNSTRFKSPSRQLSSRSIPADRMRISPIKENLKAGEDTISYVLQKHEIFGDVTFTSGKEADHGSQTSYVYSAVVSSQSTLPCKMLVLSATDYYRCTAEYWRNLRQEVR